MHRRVVAAMKRPISPFWMITQGLASTVTPEREPAHQMTLTFLHHQDPLPSPQSSGPLGASPFCGSPTGPSGHAWGERGQTTRGTGQEARHSCAAHLSSLSWCTPSKALQVCPTSISRRRCQCQRTTREAWGDPPGARGQQGLGGLWVERGRQGCLGLGFRPAQARLVSRLWDLVLNAGERLKKQCSRGC